MRLLLRTPMSPLGRVIRFALGIVTLGAFDVIPSPWRYAALLGLGLIATAIVGWCPLLAVVERVAPPIQPR